MLEYDRIDLSEVIEFSKCKDTSKKNVVYASFIIF